MDVNSAWTGDVGWGLFPDAASGGRTLWQPCSGLAQEAGTCMSAQAPIEDTRPAPIRPGGLRMRRRLLTVPLAILALLCVAAPAQAYIYWTQGNGSGGPIGRASLDGTRVNQEFITRASSTGIAVDGAHIYWTNNVGDTETVGRANLNGTRVDRSFITLAGPSYAHSIYGVAVDGTHIYWTEQSGNTTTIGRANLDGTAVNQSFITAGSGVFGVAVDGAHIYWTIDNQSTDGIGRANLDGTGVDQSFITGASGANQVAVDGAHIYWTNFGTRIGRPGTIGRASLDGTGVDQRFITGATSPDGIAVDPAHVYWANYTDTIGRANLDGARVSQRFITNAGASGIAVDALGPTAGPPTGRNVGVYINCQNEIGANGFPTETLIPLQHPRTCVVFGQPESISTLYPLVHARWKGWGKATTTVNATWDNPSPREGPPSPIQAKAFRIRRGCDGRRFYTRVAMPGIPHAIVLHVSAACKLPPL